MIEELIVEIQELEQILIDKKVLLAALQEEKSYENPDQFITIVEIQDQFDCIAEITLISDDTVTVQGFLDNYPTNWCSCYTFKFYKVSDLKENFLYLKKRFAYQSDNDSIYDWMNVNESKLIKTHEC